MRWVEEEDCTQSGASTNPPTFNSGSRQLMLCSVMEPSKTPTFNKDPPRGITKYVADAREVTPRA